MASTVLPNGIIIPEKFSRDWYNDLYHNWQELDNLLGGGTPKDGTLTIQKNGDTVGTFSANQATDETINITVPAVNDATLTIQKNGTTVDTFTANSSTDKTVDITVPTKTSDLTNDSNFVPSSDLATVATSGNYNDLSNKPTIPTVNNATLTIQQNGTNVQTFTANQSTNATANITVPTKTSDLTNDSGFITEDNTKIPLSGSNAISGDLIPATTDAYDLGGPSYQWNNAYIKSLTINGVSCGDILTHNASEFVDVSNNQTIGGVKTFSNIIFGLGSQIILRRNDVERTVLPASNVYASFSFNDKSGTGSSSRFSAVENVIRTNGDINLDLRAYDFSTKSNTHTTVVLERKYDGTSNFYPGTNNAVNLGTSTNKWKTFNGINPGALSLPSNSYVNVDTTNWVLDGSNVNSFTPTSDGWLGIQVTDTVYDQMHYVFAGRTGGGNTYYQQNVLSPINALWDGEYHGCVFIPVIKNVGYDIRCICSTIVATFYPCQGNI